MLDTHAPHIERVVKHHAVLQHLVVIGEQAGKTKRHSRQPGCLRRKVEPRRIGSAYDRRQARECWIAVEGVVLDEGVEAAQISVMREVASGTS